MENLTIKEYTNSIQHNVIATVIDNLNKKKSLVYIDKSKVGTGENILIKEIDYEISTINAMSEILSEIHKLGYKITKGK